MKQTYQQAYESAQAGGMNETDSHAFETDQTERAHPAPIAPTRALTAAAGIYVDTNHLTASVLATDQSDARHQMLLARPDHDQLRGTSWRRIVRWMRSPTEDEQITLAERRKS
jgi:hypothetical protein